jgi:hypothetical protein
MPLRSNKERTATGKDEVSSEWPELTLAEISELGKTDPKGADLALGRIRRRREAEAFASTNDFWSISDFSPVEVIEHVDDIGAEAKDASIDKIIHERSAPAATTHSDGVEVDASELERQDTLRAKERLRKLMRETRAKLDGGGSVSEDDPLAKDKRRVANVLKRAGRTLNDLPADWDRLPETARFVGERSRRSEMYRVVEEGQKELYELERLRELKSEGRPANYDRLPIDGRERVDTKLRQRRFRAKTLKAAPRPAIVPLPIVDVAGADLRGKIPKMQRAIKNWASDSSNPIARQLRQPEQQGKLVRAAIVYALYFHQNHRPPSQAEFGKWLRCSKDKARRRLDVLKSLFDVGGPWTRL